MYIYIYIIYIYITNIGDSKLELFPIIKDTPGESVGNMLPLKKLVSLQ